MPWAADAITLLHINLSNKQESSRKRRNRQKRFVARKYNNSISRRRKSHARSSLSNLDLKKVPQGARKISFMKEAVAHRKRARRWRKAVNLGALSYQLLKLMINNLPRVIMVAKRLRGCKASGLVVPAMQIAKAVVGRMHQPAVSG